MSATRYIVPSTQTEQGEDKYFGMKGEHMLLQLSVKTNMKRKIQISMLNSRLVNKKWNGNIEGFFIAPK